MIAVQSRRIMGALRLPRIRERAQRGLVSLLDMLERYSFSLYELIHQAGVIQYGAQLHPPGTPLGRWGG